jgi:hypothetical protein
MEKREGYAPWSLTRKAGVQSATVNGDIEVPQFIQPVLNTGFVDEKGNWKGTKSSDETFFISDKAEGIANSGTVLFPNTANADFVNMTGFQSLFIAIKPTNGGNYGTSAVMGPQTQSFANLSPVNAAALLKGAIRRNDMDTVLVDSSEALTADVWNIFIIKSQLSDQKLLQFLVTNNSGGNSDIDFGYLRLVQ